MSYVVYTTQGFILGSSSSGEASKIYTLYTEDFGLIRAKAQSVRLISSKLRYNLEDYSFGTFSLVRGKELWRLTGVESIDLSSRQKLVRARIFSLVKRLVQGEDRNDNLFEALSAFINQKPDVNEVQILSRVLASLGYLDLESLKNYTEREIIGAINKALEETQL